MNEIAVLVDEQGEHINMITDNMNQAGENLLSANQDLDGAIEQQKKARKKYCCAAVIVLIITVLVVGVIYILNSDNP